MGGRLASTALVSVMSVSLAAGAKAQGTVKLVVGIESLDEDYWSPTDEPTDLGLAVTFPVTRTGVFAEVGVLLLSDSGSAIDPGSGLVVDADLSGRELFAGIGYEVEVAPGGRQFAFVAGGISQTEVELTVELRGFPAVSDDDTSSGAYLTLGGGTRSGTVEFGAALRIRANTEITLFTVQGDVDSVTLLVSVGYSF
jgi:hypothetical protein